MLKGITKQKSIKETILEGKRKFKLRSILSSKKAGMLAVLLCLAQVSMSANGLPFYDTLELGLKLVRVIGSVIAICSGLACFYFYSEGNRDVVKKGAWFVGAGILTANIQWFADQMGLMAGAIF